MAISPRQLVPVLPVNLCRVGRWCLIGLLFWAGLARLPAAFGATPTVPAVAESKVRLDTNFWVGSWIWGAVTEDKQTCRFWKTFTVPTGTVVTKALVRITADNGYRLFLDGRELGRGSDWKALTEYDITWVLEPGRHVVAVEAFNDRLQAGVLFGLRIELVSGAVLEIGSDETWRFVPTAERDWEARTQAPAAWPAATVAGQFRHAPWETPPLAVTPVPPLLPVEHRFWQSGWFQVVLVVVCVGVGAFCLRLMAQLGLQARAQAMLHRERERIARDIHDDLGAGMTQLVLMGEIAQHGMEADSPERRQVDGICEKARDLLGSMDEVVWAVSPRRDTLRDFSVYVCQYATKFLESTGIRCRLDVEPQLPASAFDLPVRRSLLMAVKEALNNAAKHSGASELFIRIHRDAEAIVVMVEDDGRGFDPAAPDGSRNGLGNMADRLREAGGRCEIRSAPGQGCRVELSMPLVARRQRPWSRRRPA
jgi:signal transduction histidine kinase